MSVNPKILTVSDTTDLQAKGRPDSMQILVESVGIFNWASSGTPNGSTIFSATGGGVWKKVLSPGGGNSLVTLTDASTTTWNYTTGNCAEWAIAGNRTLSITNVTSGVPSFGILKITQGAGGNFIPVLPGNSDDVVWRLDEGEVNVIGFYYDGTDYHWSSSHSVVVVYGDQLDAPENFTATMVSDTAIDLDWDAVAGATSYRLQRSTDPTFRSGVVLIYTGSSTSFSDTGLTATTHYYYRNLAKASGLANSLYSFTDTTTDVPGPVMLTWFSIESDIEQYNSNQGLRKISGHSAGWVTSQAWSNETISVGQTANFKIGVSGIITMGLHPTRTANNNTTPDWDFVMQYIGTWLYGTNNPSENDSGIGTSTGDIIRMSFTGSNIVIEKSVDSGANWTSVGTLAGASGSYYVAVKIYGNNSQTGFSEIYKQ